MGFMMFSADDICDAKHIPVEDWLEYYAFGVILQQCFIEAGLKKFQERGEKRATKEVAQMHIMSVFRPILRTDLTPRREEEGNLLPHVSEGKEGQDSERTIILHGREETTKRLDKARVHIAKGFDDLTESVFLTAVIDAHEHVVTWDATTFQGLFCMQTATKTSRWC